MKGQQVIEPRFLEYQYVETVLLHLDGYYTGGQPLNTNERAYFDPNSIKRGRRVIAIENVAYDAAFQYNGVTILASALPGGVSRFTLTMCDDQNNELIKNLPCMELNPVVTFGRIRIFNIIPDLEKCFVTNTSTPIAQTNRGLLFNFYTVDW